MVGQDEEKGIVKVYCDNGPSRYIEDVELVQYTNDVEAVKWVDNGSEVERLRMEMEVIDLRRKEFEKLSGTLRLNYFDLWLIVESLAQSTAPEAEKAQKTLEEIQQRMAKMDEELAAIRAEREAVEQTIKDTYK
jgi:hypothetical protein